jgi:hypothetical protein
LLAEPAPLPALAIPPSPFPPKAAWRQLAQGQTKPQVELKRGDYVVIVAKLNLSKTTGKILHVKHVQQAQVPTTESANTAVIRLLNREGTVIGTYPQWIRQDSDRLEGEDATALINATIPEARNAGAVELVLRGVVVDRIEIPATAPRIASASVRRSDPGGNPVIAWERSPNDNVSYEVSVSADDGRTWETVATGYREASFDLSSDLLLGRKATVVRIIASDGYNESRPAIVRIP